MECPYCHSENIETGIAWGKANETANVGLKYTRGGMFSGVAQVYADLCRDCKSLIRMYIKEDTDLHWVHTPGTFGTK